jgi:hypothetical protein
MEEVVEINELRQAGDLTAASCEDCHFAVVCLAECVNKVVRPSESQQVPGTAGPAVNYKTVSQS